MGSFLPGSLFQRPILRETLAGQAQVDTPYQAQVLRFYARGPTLLLERRWVVRDLYGSYDLVGGTDTPAGECLSYAVLANGVERVERG